MRIGIIDADLLGRKKHRFPNLACEKISGYYKDHGHSVELVLDYNDMNKYDKVFISKVFTDTQIAPHIIQADNVEIGGTGFYFDKAPALPECIEHNMPDYHLYDEFSERTPAYRGGSTFTRIALLFRYGCLPYIMRFQNKNDMPWKMSEFRSLYITLARWCNQPSIVKKMSFRDFCELNQEVHKNKDTLCSSMDAMRKFEKGYPDIAKYFDIRFENR